MDNLIPSAPHLEAISTAASAIVALAAIFITSFFAWRPWRDAIFRRPEVLTWANEVIKSLQSLSLICSLTESALDIKTATTKLAEIIFDTSVLVERGRLFFKNEVIDDFGAEKELAYRGYRPTILDPIVVAHQIACRWLTADRDTRLRLRCVAEDSAREFVSLAQREVGRSRTASSYTRLGGLGLPLDHLLEEVDSVRLRRLDA